VCVFACVCTRACVRMGVVARVRVGVCVFVRANTRFSSDWYVRTCVRVLV